jgi:acyl-CoA thioesterase-1
LLQAELDARGYNYRVVNAGVSGDTTSSGLQRMRQVLSLKPSIVLLELGGNDGLRGLPIEVTRSNLEEMIVALRDAGATVALAGMTLPRNYGQTYIRQFEELYRSLAAKYRLRLVPFEIEPLAARGMLQDDGIHPTADGYRAALPRIFSELAPLLIK